MDYDTTDLQCSSQPATSTLNFGDLSKKKKSSLRPRRWNILLRSLHCLPGCQRIDFNVWHHGNVGFYTVSQIHLWSAAQLTTAPWKTKHSEESEKNVCIIHSIWGKKSQRKIFKSLTQPQASQVHGNYIKGLKGIYILSNMNVVEKQCTIKPVCVSLLYLQTAHCG